MTEKAKDIKATLADNDVALQAVIDREEKKNATLYAQRDDLIVQIDGLRETLRDINAQILAAENDELRLARLIKDVLSKFKDGHAGQITRQLDSIR